MGLRGLQVVIREHKMKMECICFAGHHEPCSTCESVDPVFKMSITR